jgi:GNAT superfamily N-acetyltransferase
MRSRNGCGSRSKRATASDSNLNVAGGSHRNPASPEAAMNHDASAIQPEGSAPPARVTFAPMRTKAEHDEVVRLCNRYLAWKRERYAELVWTVDLYYPPQIWDDLMRNLPVLHAPPRGEILLARVRGEAVGCVMMEGCSQAVCEMKRLFVLPHVHRTGVGRQLCEALLALAYERGYRKMRLETGIRHSEAQRLYRAIGFRTIAFYQPVPEAMRPHVVAMERPLDRPVRVWTETPQPAAASAGRVTVPEEMVDRLVDRTNNKGSS